MLNTQRPPSPPPGPPEEDAHLDSTIRAGDDVYLYNDATVESAVFGTATSDPFVYRGVRSLQATLGPPICDEDRVFSKWPLQAPLRYFRRARDVESPPPIASRGHMHY